MGNLIQYDDIGSLIRTIRGQRVILDFDLARIYGVPTRRLNEQIKRNAKRFPADFLFQLTTEEAETLMLMRSQFATASKTASAMRSQIATADSPEFVSRMLKKPMQFEIAPNRVLIINDLHKQKTANFSFSAAC